MSEQTNGSEGDVHIYQQRLEKERKGEKEIIISILFSSLECII